ncbi:hypothetical protein GCM10023259_076160 [Thermocatellispora tengchongensis]
MPAPSWVRTEVCTWSVGANDVVIVTPGFTFRYAATSSSMGAFWSATPMNFSAVAASPPAPAVAPVFCCVEQAESAAGAAAATARPPIILKNWARLILASRSQSLSRLISTLLVRGVPPASQRDR